MTRMLGKILKFNKTDQEEHMKRKGYDIYIGKRGAIYYLETIEETNPLVADTYAYDKALDKFGDIPEVVWKAIPAVIWIPEDGRE